MKFDLNRLKDRCIGFQEVSKKSVNGERLTGFTVIVNQQLSNMYMFLLLKLQKMLKLNSDVAAAMAPSRSELVDILFSVVSKHVFVDKIPSGKNRVDYFAEMLYEITKKNFMAFIDCSEKWVKRKSIKHNPIDCPEMTVKNAAFMELNGIRISAMRADLEAELKDMRKTTLLGALRCFFTHTPHVTHAPALDNKVIFVTICHA